MTSDVVASDSVMPGDQRLRADALRNRDQIVAAARTLFVARGVDIPMDDIAREAGVGKGTLYRRFPDRESLIQAAALDISQRLASMASAAWDEEPDAWSALSRFLRHWGSVRLGLLRPALCNQMPDAQRAIPELAKARQTWLGLLDLMIGRAQADGVLRPDVGTGDLAAFMNMLARQPELPGGRAELARSRFLELLLAGLRVRSGDALPGEPITSVDLDLGDPVPQDAR